MKQLNEKGSSLILVLGTGLLLLTTVYSLNYWLDRDRELKNYYAGAESAFYLAEAGIEQVLWHLANDYSWFIQPVTENLPGQKSFFAQVDNLERLILPPEEENDSPGLLVVEVNSLGTDKTNKERIQVKVELTYHYGGEVSFKIITWERKIP